MLKCWQVHEPVTFTYRSLNWRSVITCRMYIRAQLYIGSVLWLASNSCSCSSIFNDSISIRNLLCASATSVFVRHASVSWSLLQTMCPIQLDYFPKNASNQRSKSIWSVFGVLPPLGYSGCRWWFVTQSPHCTGLPLGLNNIYLFQYVNMVYTYNR